jgi:hypothetical protein
MKGVQYRIRDPKEVSHSKQTLSLISLGRNDKVLRHATIGGVFDRHDFACCLRKQRSCPEKYDTGATDTEIKIGNIMPYSGPASAWGVIGKTEAAYFHKINDEGGISGRKIIFISYDDAYSPPKTVEQARKLVEADEVLLIFGPLGTPSNTAIQRHMNAKKVPQLFVQTGATELRRRCERELSVSGLSIGSRSKTASATGDQNWWWVDIQFTRERSHADIPSALQWRQSCRAGEPLRPGDPADDYR